MKELIEQVTHRALASGHLLPIQTRIERIGEAGIDWVVRVVERLADKPRAGERAGEKASKKESPWLPPEPDLIVSYPGDDYIMTLNKFPVIEGHGLIVTRDFVDQRAPLIPADFEVLKVVMDAFPAPGALGFYNGGTEAGASQRHKHLQVVPLPLAENGDRPLPVDPLTMKLPFTNAVTRLTGEESAGRQHRLYEDLRDQLGLSPSMPYNLLITTGWMMLVPRSRERYEGISVNSLGFAGCLLAANDDQLAIIRTVGPGAIVHSVTD